MARDDWVAVVTDPSAEYVAWAELLPLRAASFPAADASALALAQQRQVAVRHYPSFPRYLLLPIRAVKHDALPLCRGLRKFKPILSDAEGHLWRAPDWVIAAVREAETRGDFDEILVQGDQVRLAKGALRGVEAVLTEIDRDGRLNVLLPLFGVAKATVPQADVARAGG
jgi:hypothetical protein